MVYDKIIEGKLVYLRPVEISDAEYIYNIRQDNKKTKFLNPVNGTVDDQVEWIKKQREREGDYYFIIVDKMKNIPIGANAIYDINGDSFFVGRTLCFGNPFQSMESNILLSDLGFFNFKLKKALAKVLKDNKIQMGINKKFNMTVIKEEFNEAFGLIEVFSELDSETYKEGREKVVELIDKFSKRYKK